MPSYTYSLESELREGGGFLVTVPAIPGCFGEGETYEHAMHEAEEAILSYLEAAVGRGDAISCEPAPSDKLAVRVSWPRKDE